MRSLLLIATVLSFSLLSLSGPWLEPADGCAPAPRRGVSVAIADESAIIIWHEASKTEHFIRRATFATDAQDFGFLVPTPTAPELGEASDEAFDELTMLYAKKANNKLAPKQGAGGGKGNQPQVEVLEEKRVAGQDVVVLKANDAAALAKWLTDHGYDFSATLKDWVKPYIDAKWIITASKIAKDKNGATVKNVSSTAVRMSFKTEKPFFPYREPADQASSKTASRLLRVFFIGADQVQGRIGDSAAWPGQVVYNSKLTDQLSSKLLHLLKLPSGNTVPTTWHLTVFEDRSSPRPGTDEVYFSARK